MLGVLYILFTISPDEDEGVVGLGDGIGAISGNVPEKTGNEAVFWYEY
jgi:hypothetical protein